MADVDTLIQEIWFTFAKAQHRMLLASRRPTKFELIAWYRPSAKDSMRQLGECTVFQSASGAFHAAVAAIVKRPGYSADPLLKVVTIGDPFLKTMEMARIMERHGISGIGINLE
jgi:hypothetical protein